MRGTLRFSWIRVSLQKDIASHMSLCYWFSSEGLELLVSVVSHPAVHINLDALLSMEATIFYLIIKPAFTLT